MKITIDVECTPQEARECLGFPDVAALQDAVMDKVREQLLSNLTAMEPEALLKTWLPAGIESFERVQTAFWSQVASAARQSDEVKTDTD